MSETASDLVIGIDIGTGGVRALAADASGNIVAQAQQPLEAPTRREGAVHEQNADSWWAATCAVCHILMAELNRRGRQRHLRAVCVDGTSGTLLCLDAQSRPLRPAIMYNDGRPTAEAARLNELAGDFCSRMGYSFAASFALAKALWVKRNEPEVFARTARFLHQGDYLAARLCGRFDTSDYSNALKSGYDLLDDRWPDWLAREDGLRERLPDVVAPGTPIGQLAPAAAEDTALPAGLAVVAGVTDGTAGFLASGVRRPGDYNTTLGTTLVFKGLATALCRHPRGLIYCHKLPGASPGTAMWLPGAASNTGAEWIARQFPGADPAALDAAAASRLPTHHIAYPLAGEGERFPFLWPQARGFCIPPADGAELYAAQLQGTALLERLGYDVLDQTCSVSGGDVYATGGGSRSDVWMQCRADVTARSFHRPACAEAAFGAAVLAAAGCIFPNLWEAMARMVRIERSFAPNPGRAGAFDAAYEQFKHELHQRGYL
jgi:sugar (pentulose or hexulose) kinase